MSGFGQLARWTRIGQLNRCLGVDGCNPAGCDWRGVNR